MPGPQHADPERSLQVAGKQFAWPLETSPHGAGRAFEVIAVPQENAAEPAELQTLV